MRLGIFGGTFDPVHYGHLLLAEGCREQVSLDLVWFMPAAIPPHKKTVVISEDRHRVEMLSLAIAGNPSFAICPHEIERGGVNYTVETLAFLQEQDPKRELFFLMGGDSLADLPTWKEPARICELATIVVVNRPGMAELRFDLLANHLPSKAIEQIRQQVSDGKSIRYRTPRAVEMYIETHGLYQT